MNGVMDNDNLIVAMFKSNFISTINPIDKMGLSALFDSAFPTLP